MLAAIVVVAMLLAATPSPASADASYVGGSSDYTYYGEVSLPAPNGTAAGDVMVAAVVSTSTAAPTAPAGWTSVSSASAQMPASMGSLWVYFRVATGAEPPSYDWNVGSQYGGDALIATYRGVDTSQPIDTASSLAGANRTDPIGPSVTTGWAGDAVFDVLGYLTTNSGAARPSNTAAGPNVYESSPQGGFVLLQSGYFFQGPAAATGTQTFRGAATVNHYVAATIALKPAIGALSFGTAPALPALSNLTLGGGSQTVTAKMPAFGVSDQTASGSGWNLTVAGDSAAGKSAVFKQYCAVAPCSSRTSVGYVDAGFSLPAGSLTLRTSGASLAGGVGAAPGFLCNAGCAVDGASAAVVARAAVNRGVGTWQTAGLSSTSLALSIPSTLRRLGSGETYRVDVVWTLSSGP